MTRKLAYESPYQPPSELDHEFEIAWANSLRRRFLWYCGVVLAISIPECLILLLLIALIAFSVITTRTHWVALLVTQYGLGRLLYVIAWWHTFRIAPKRKTILAIAFWLYVTTSALALLGSRYLPDAEFEVNQVYATTQPATSPLHEKSFMDSIREMSQQKAQLTTRSSTRPATAPVVGRTSASRGQKFAAYVPIGIFFNHLFLCFFLPWSFRQSLRPALVIFSFATLMCLTDLALGNNSVACLLSPLLIAIAFIPGSVWCWWRFSRYRSSFKMYYESSAYQQLQAELGNARRIHESQLPDVRSTGPLQMYYAYEPMRQIGGDLLFAYPPADIATDKLTAVVLDVTGHGVAAALFVNRLVGELERCFGENANATPGDVLRALNSHVYYALAKHSMYATAIAVQIDLNNNTLAYASAGHPDAFVRSATTPPERLLSTACMLGVIDPKSYTGDQLTRPFDVGASVLLYTDGAMEARNHETGKSLGVDGLQSIMQSLDPHLCRQWPQQLLARVAAHRKAPPEDDALIVTLCRV